MVAQKQESNIGSIPDLEATYNGSSVFLYDYDELIQTDGPSTAKLLEETEFTEDSPIKRLTITSSRQRLKSEPTAYGTVFRAEIDLQSIDEDIWDDFLLAIQNPESKFTEIDDNVYLEEDPRYRGVYRLYASDEPQLTVEINPHCPHVVVHTEPDRSIVLPPNGTEQATDVATVFMSTVARTLDVVGGTYLDDPMQFRHNKTYTLAIDKKQRVQSPILEAPKRPKAIEGAIGKQAVAQTIPAPEVTPAERPATFNDIAGYDDLKKRLSYLAEAFARPEVFAKWRARRPGGVLLEGPGGTGKTTLLRALADTAGAEILEVNSHEVFTKWVGGSDKKFNELLDRAEALAGEGKRTLLLFDEIDALIQSNTGNNNERTAVRGSFKRRIPIISNNPNIILGATTNDYANLDPTLVRSGRFDLKIHVPLPNKSDRLQIALSYMDTPNLDFELWDTLTGQGVDGAEGRIVPFERVFHAFSSEVNVGLLVEATRCFSGADIANLVNRLCFGKAMQEIMGESPKPISQKEISIEISNMRDEGVGRVKNEDEPAD